MSSPIKFTVKTERFSVALIIISFLAAIYFYWHFPPLVAMHWDLKGQVNGYGNPFTAAFLMPIIMVALYIMFLILPYIDPKKDQYASFAVIYNKFKDLIISFLLIFYILVSFRGLGYMINIGLITPILVGAMFFIIGTLIKNVKMNWFLGIRTPWTLSSEKVWEKTHRMTSSVMMVSGLIMAATSFLPGQYKIGLFAFAIILIVLGLPVYSYLLFIKEKKELKAASEKK